MTQRTFIIPVVAAPVGGLPSAGTFRELGTNVFLNSTPQAVQDYVAGIGPMPVYYPPEGPNAILHAWTSGIYAPEFGAQGSYICWGGGHNSYSGNEIHRWDVATRLWSCVGTPSPYDDSQLIVGTGAFPDGKPGPSHNYSTLGIRNSANGGGASGSLVVAGLPGLYTSGNGEFAYWWQFNLATATWSKFPSDASPLNGSALPGGSISTRTMIQEPGSHFWWLGGGSPRSVTRVTQAGVATVFAAQTPNRNQGSVGGLVGSTRIMADHSVYETVGTATCLYNLPNIEAGQTGASAVKILTTTGTPAAWNDSLTWVPDRNAFASISSISPTTIRWLTPSNSADPWNSSWTWTAETYTASGAVSDPGDAGNGSHGRARWVPAIKCLLWATRLNGKMIAFKPYGVS